MYTDSIEKERELVLSLWQSHDTNMADGETSIVCECPNCHKGNIITRCTHGIVNGELRSWRFDSHCDFCNEAFVISRINADIFFNTPHKMIDKLETPFGDIHVWTNGKQIPFRYRTDIYEDEENAPDKPVLMHIIDKDLSDMEKDDIIFCGFEDDILEYNDGDERSMLYSCEDDNRILGLCAFEPDVETEYCFWLEEYEKNGFGYRITSSPGNFDEHDFYQSKFISLAVSWLNKADYEDADLMTFLALTCVIG